MLPLTLLRTAQNAQILVELKNGETYNGTLDSCDSWMNINLKDVIHTSKDGDKFWKVAECYIRGNTIKYLCIPDEIIDRVADFEASQPPPTRANKLEGPRGSRGGRGGDRGSRGGRGNDRGGRGGGDRGGRGGRGNDRGGRGGDRGDRGGRGRGRGN
eukprot:TRINITY_DN844_c0_g1_i1.p1 TRINITY_DN844_c0_g1~~TRINITY_DN844_c0_g1_i1.p1  ORF type:complete len:157 (+),score=60.79 TRINITY_DN844_c0_g1_i1:58-528(+)